MLSRFRKVVQILGEELGALDGRQQRLTSRHEGGEDAHPNVIRRIKLFICRVSTIITPSNGQQADVDAENVGEFQGDGD